MAYLEYYSSTETSLVFRLQDITPGIEYGLSRKFYFTCNGETKTVNVSATSTSTHVSSGRFNDLEPGTTYTCECEFTDSHGTTYSWDAEGTTDDPTPPPPPPKFSYTSTQNSITMRWDNAYGYDLLFELLINGEWESHTIVVGDTRSYTFRYLDSGTYYQYRSSVIGTSHSSSGSIRTEQETQYRVYVYVYLNDASFSNGSFTYRGSTTRTISSYVSAAGASIPSIPQMALQWESTEGFPHIGTQLTDTCAISGKNGSIRLYFTSDPGSYKVFILEDGSYNEYEIHIFNGTDFNDVYKPYIFNGTSWSEV